MLKIKLIFFFGRFNFNCDWISILSFHLLIPFQRLKFNTCIIALKPPQNLLLLSRAFDHISNAFMGIASIEMNSININGDAPLAWMEMQFYKQAWNKTHSIVDYHWWWWYRMIQISVGNLSRHELSSSIGLTYLFIIDRNRNNSQNTYQMLRI